MKVNVIITAINFDTKEKTIVTTMELNNIPHEDCYRVVTNSHNSVRKSLPMAEITTVWGTCEVSVDPKEWTEDMNFITSPPFRQEKDEELVDEGMMSFDEYEQKWYPTMWEKAETSTSHDQYDAGGCGYW